MKMQIGALALSCLLIGACTSTTKESANHRRPSSDDEERFQPPPQAQFHPGWAFTWTKSEYAKNPQQNISRKIDAAKICFDKFEKAIDAGSEERIEGCDGNEMAAGPGIYTCDNPFFSHDYGNTVLAIPLVDNNGYVSLATGRYTPRESEDMERLIYANRGYDGIMYDFIRAVPTRAMTIRTTKIIDPAKVYVVDLTTIPARRFNEHAAFVCNDRTPIKDILSNWGDQIEFMSFIYRTDLDPSAKDFIEGVNLNNAGAAAALASDVVALTPMNGGVEALMRKFPNLAEVMEGNNCRNTDSMSQRSCLARRIFDTLLNNQGNGRNPVYQVDAKTLTGIMMQVGLVAAKDAARLNSGPKMLAELKPLYSSKYNQGKRALEAAACVKAAKKQIATWEFSSWGEDPSY